MVMSYNQLLASCENLLVDTGSQNLIDIFPQAIQQAENLLYRELDLLSCRASDTSVTLISGSRDATCPSDISVVEGISLLSPAGQTLPTAARIGLERASLDFMDMLYGAGSSATGMPEYYAMKSDTAIVFAPTPNGSYHIEITGTVDPAPMSNSNQTTFLGNQFPDLLLAAVMMFMTGWQQNFGAQSDNPQMSQSWKSTYDTLLPSASEYVQRQKSQSPNWTPFTPTPLSTPRT